MAELSLTDIFGTGATQDGTSITILKSALTATGLTASSSNTGESLVGALFKKWQLALNTAAQTANADIQVTIEDSFQNVVTRNGVQYRRFTKTINFDVVDTTTDFDPDLL